MDRDTPAVWTWPSIEAPGKLDEEDKRIWDADAASSLRVVVASRSMSLSLKARPREGKFIGDAIGEFIGDRCGEVESFVFDSSLMMTSALPVDSGVVESPKP